MFAGSCMNKTIKFDIVREVPVEACAQALHLEQSREVTREQHAKGDSLQSGVKSGKMTEKSRINP